MLLIVCMMIGYAHRVSPANAMSASLRGSKKTLGHESHAPAQRRRLSEAKRSSSLSPIRRSHAQAIVIASA
jgi:hypothetical protein